MVAAAKYRGMKVRMIWPVAAAIGGVIALCVAGLPSIWLDVAIVRSGLPDIVAAASPPVGVTGRTILALVTGAGAMLLMAGVGFSIGRMSRTRAPRDDGSAPVLRRADAHPDAPSRRPIRAHEDLGLPWLAVEPSRAVTERPLPFDLNLPLSAYDPEALPAAPAEPVRPVESLAARRALIDPGERFESFELPRTTITEPTIGALLDRLERGTKRAPHILPGKGSPLMRGLATG